MTLPIIEAILRGDFRPTLIKETVPEEYGQWKIQITKINVNICNDKNNKERR